MSSGEYFPKDLLMAAVVFSHSDVSHKNVSEMEIYCPEF